MRSAQSQTSQRLKQSSSQAPILIYGTLLVDRCQPICISCLALTLTPTTTPTPTLMEPQILTRTPTPDPTSQT